MRNCSSLGFTGAYTSAGFDSDSIDFSVVFLTSHLADLSILEYCFSGLSFPEYIVITR